jgi:hypothetical protein
MRMELYIAQTDNGYCKVDTGNTYEAPYSRKFWID